MNRPDQQRGNEGQGGVPDGLLLGSLAFLLGLTLLVWSATGIAGWFTSGGWPHGVTFTRTPLAVRHLIGRPSDLTGAWPTTPPSQLSGYGLFWGLFIGQLMLLFVLTVFAMSRVAHWKAARARRHTPPPAPQEVPAPRTEPQPPQPTYPTQQLPPTPVPPVVTAPAPPAVPVPVPEPAAPVPPAYGGWENVVIGPAEKRRAAAAQAVREAVGPALVLTSDPALWQETKDARAKLGPVHLYDPAHRCDTPARLHWSPIAGCESKDTARERAAALLAAIRPIAKIDQAVADVAETLLRSYVHAAAVDGRTVRHVHRWSQGNQVQDAVRILRTHPKAAPGAAGELEATLTAHPERRDMAQELTGRALSALSTVNIREACTPNRTDALALDSFVLEGGTLYLVGESIEDPRSDPGAMPLLTALVSSVVERGRHMAERSSAGRLDPPLTLVLDDVAAVAPLPQLPELLASGAEQGLPTLALLRSREQARSRWPHAELPV
ncbi:type IV secretory system conjugative DNA transfer family protein [Streptomyces sp. NPDC094437]|uniref:type IV secretory system conjugative DNA transfer family protein n=1 Tax=Streptomyces sp. NPDC094437 TaxID=3366060 RepID=UPI0037F8F6A1